MAQHYINDSNYGDNQLKLPIDYDPPKYLSCGDAAKALYEALKPVVTAYGQDPASELCLFDPSEALQRGYGNNWTVSWEAGPSEWGIVASSWLYGGPLAAWFTEPHFSFDLTFTEIRNMAHRIVTVQFIIEETELTAAHQEHKTIYAAGGWNDEAAFAADLQQNAYDGGGQMHGSFKVLDVSKPVKGRF